MSGAKDASGEQFARYAEAVGRELLGEPNKKLSSKTELRWGDRGSVSLDIGKGTFFSHKDNEGGGVLWLIQREKSLAEPRQAVEWMKANDFPVEDREPPRQQQPSTQGGGQQREYKPPRHTKAGHRIPADRIPDHAELTKVYDYREAAGTLRYQVVRFDWDDPEHEKGHDKTFLQRRPDSKNRDGWSYSVKGIEPLPYRLPELLADIEAGEEIFIVEGEKKVDLLRDHLGVPATCNSGGSGKWPELLVDHFRGASVTIIGDNDEAGQKHVRLVGGKLAPIAKRVRALDIPGLPPKGSVDDWIPAGGTAERLYELAASLGRPIDAQPFESRFGAVLWRDIDAPGPVHEYLIKGLLSASEMSMVAGESQSGKTFLVLDAAMSIARGVPFFGRRVRQGAVIYQAGEGARAVRRKRLKAYRTHFNCADENVPFALLEKPIDLYASDDQTEAFIEEVRALSRQMGAPPALIVIDTFSKATPGINENDSADVGRVLERGDRIRLATGAHVMFVHHMNAEGAKPRGHTSLLANLETVVITRKLADHHDKDNRIVREFELAKQKDGEAGSKTKFVLPVIQIGTDEDGDPVTSCIVAPPSGEAGAEIRKEEGIQLGGANAKVLRSLYEVIEKNGVFAPPSLGLPQGWLVANRKDHGARYAELETPDDRRPEDMEEAERKAFSDRLRQQLKRARDLLYTKKIIGMDGDWIWLTGKPVQGFGPAPGTKREREKKTTAAKSETAPSGSPAPFADDDLIDGGFKL